MSIDPKELNRLFWFFVAAKIMIDAGPSLGPPEPPLKDQRISISTAPKSPHESIGILKSLGSGCTQTYQGNNISIVAAHCLKEAAKTEPEKLLIGFNCEKRDGHYECPSESPIIEIAIPENYVPETGPSPSADNHGYDIAFVRVRPVKGTTLPEPAFPLSSDSIVSLNVLQAGYAYDRSGLTGDFSCAIQPPWTKTNELPNPFTIQTNCYIVSGDSGGPLLDQNNHLIGITSKSNIEEGGHTAAATPITPGLRQAFESFRAGTLKGTTTVSDINGVKIIRFPYQRTAPVYSTGGSSTSCC